MGASLNFRNDHQGQSPGSGSAEELEEVLRPSYLAVSSHCYIHWWLPSLDTQMVLGVNV